jgi:hypothetical protein
MPKKKMERRNQLKAAAKPARNGTKKSIEEEVEIVLVDDEERADNNPKKRSRIDSSSNSLLPFDTKSNDGSKVDQGFIDAIDWKVLSRSITTTQFFVSPIYIVGGMVGWAWEQQ